MKRSIMIIGVVLLLFVNIGCESKTEWVELTSGLMGSSKFKGNIKFTLLIDDNSIKKSGDIVSVRTMTTFTPPYTNAPDKLQTKNIQYHEVRCSDTFSRTIRKTHHYQNGTEEEITEPAMGIWSPTRGAMKFMTKYTCGRV